MDRDTWAAGLWGNMSEHLKGIPQAEWTTHHMHAALLSAKNLHALRLLLSAHVEIPWIATHDAARRGYFDMVELLCAAGANLRAPDLYGEEPLQATFQSGEMRFRLAARVLVANGVRVSTMPRKWKSSHGGMHIDESAWRLTELMKLERHIDSARRQVIALLRAKAVCRLVWWDKFLLKEIALQVWADRTNEEG